MSWKLFKAAWKASKVGDMELCLAMCSSSVAERRETDFDRLLAVFSRKARSRSLSAKVESAALMRSLDDLRPFNKSAFGSMSRLSSTARDGRPPASSGAATTAPTSSRLLDAVRPSAGAEARPGPRAGAGCTARHACWWPARPSTRVGAMAQALASSAADARSVPVPVPSGA